MEVEAAELRPMCSSEFGTFGPIINELYPQEMPMAGLMIMTPPSSSPPAP